MKSAEMKTEKVKVEGQAVPGNFFFLNLIDFFGKNVQNSWVLISKI